MVYSEVTDSNGYAPVADVACDVEVSIQVNRVGFVETTTVSPFGCFQNIQISRF